ncbi:MAG: TPM domain-containing protein [Ignavibacteriales bacterium]
MNRELIYKYFDDDDFLVISNKIKDAEKKTSGEIRVSIKEKRKLIEYNKPIRKLAEKEFVKMGMQNTRDKTGILLYILLSERQFYILADEGINSKVEQSTWDKIRDEIQFDFKDGKFTEGIVSCIDKVATILAEFFPIKIDDTNELSNKVEF